MNRNKTTALYALQAFASLGAASVALSLFFSSPVTAATVPAQIPLLTSVAGAKPNMMITLDNSGSMIWAYTDSYSVTSKVKTKGKYCEDYGDDESANGAPSASNQCKTLVRISNNKSFCVLRAVYDGWRTDPVRYRDFDDVYASSRSDCNNSRSGGAYIGGEYDVYDFVQQSPGVGIKEDSPWYAQRSADVNAVYYNPRTTYLPRVDAAGVPLPITDGVVFVSNQDGSSSLPTQVTYTTTSSSTPGFTWVTCPDVIRNANGDETGCKGSTLTEVTIKPGSPTSIVLPADHRRTDCPTGICTNAQEITNIVNWNRYYYNRASAMATSIGLALSNPVYKNRLRIGYYSINNGGNSNSLQPGVNVTSPDRLRGVRLSSLANNAELYSWLYGSGSTPNGGTPLHNSVIKIADYYKVLGTSVENPWASDPSKKSNNSDNKELSCRRSFNLLFSDGAWNEGTYAGEGSNANDFTDAPTAISGTVDGAAVSFKYKAKGDASDTKLYTPYGSSRVGGLADLTATYAWKQDFRTSLDNKIIPTDGKPMFWQNMITYTVGYMIAPSGANKSSGLTFEQIADYSAYYKKYGYTAAQNAGLVPTWATGDGSEPARVDDFIQAGFTGGGAGYSVTTSDDIKRTFDAITSDILNSEGKDAGVAASSSGSGANSLSTSAVKFTTEYKTIDNTGDIKAYKLDADGKVVDAKPSTATEIDPLWSARKVLADTIQSKSNVTWRKLFSFDSATSSPVTLANGTATLPVITAAVASRLDPLGFFSSTNDKSNLIKYILGDDSQSSALGTPLRQRKSLVAASVNSAPVLASDGLNMGYDASLAPGVNVDGKTTYGKGVVANDFSGGVLTGAPLNFLGKKTAYPSNLYSANNDGLVHVFNGAKITDETTLATNAIDAAGNVLSAGQEVAAFMPMGVGSKLKKFASPSYSFEYVLDGPMSEEDIYDARTVGSEKWRHILYGTSGRADAGDLGTGRFIYALDAPFNDVTGGKNRIPDASSFLWERSWPDLGYVSNLPSAGQLSAEANGGNAATANKWVVLSNSGHYTATGKSGLYVLDALTGEQIAFIPTTSGVPTGRGLGGVSVVRDRARRIVAAYAGDAVGNLWRFNLGTTFSATKIFTTENSRPIYGAPAWQLARGGKYSGSFTLNGAGGTSTTATQCSSDKRDGKCGTIVVFGTGMMLDEDDRANSATQAIYGVWDPTPINAQQVSTVFPIGTALLEQTMVSTGTKVANDTGIDYFYSVSRNAIDYNAAHNGWKLQLGSLANATGERVIADAANLGSAVAIYSTIIKPASASDEELCTKGNAAPNLIYILNGRDGAGTYGFRTSKLGAPVPYSVGYLESGGFSRGIAYQDSGSGGKREVSIETVGKTTEKILDDDATLKDCTKTTSDALGANSGPAYLLDGCAAQGWLRSWRPVLNPPQF